MWIKDDNFKLSQTSLPIPNDNNCGEFISCISYVPPLVLLHLTLRHIIASINISTLRKYHALMKFSNQVLLLLSLVSFKMYSRIQTKETKYTNSNHAKRTLLTNKKNIAIGVAKTCFCCKIRGM